MPSQYPPPPLINANVRTLLSELHKLTTMLLILQPQVLPNPLSLKEQPNSTKTYSQLRVQIFHWALKYFSLLDWLHCQSLIAYVYTRQLSLAKALLKAFLGFVFSFFKPSSLTWQVAGIRFILNVSALIHVGCGCSMPLWRKRPYTSLGPIVWTIWQGGLFFCYLKPLPFFGFVIG